LAATDLSWAIVEKSRLKDVAEGWPAAEVPIDELVGLDEEGADDVEDEDEDEVGGWVALAGEFPHAAAVRAAVANTVVKASFLVICKGSSLHRRQPADRSLVARRAGNLWEWRRTASLSRVDLAA
jgi:hypothetical protein